MAGADKRELLERIKYEERLYTIDQVELGKIMVIASLALLVVSVHATLVFQSTASEVESTSRQFDEARGIMDSEAFNDSLEALNTVQGTQIAPRFYQAARAFNQARPALSSLDRVGDTLSDTAVIYQWLVLVSILGLVAGISIIYV